MDSRYFPTSSKEKGAQAIDEENDAEQENEKQTISNENPVLFKLNNYSMTLLQ